MTVFAEQYLGWPHDFSCFSTKSGNFRSRLGTIIFYLHVNQAMEMKSTQQVCLAYIKFTLVSWLILTGKPSGKYHLGAYLEFTVRANEKNYLGHQTNIIKWPTEPIRIRKLKKFEIF